MTRLPKYLELSARWNGPDAVRAEHAPRRLSADGEAIAFAAARYLAALEACDVTPRYRSEADEVGRLVSPVVARVEEHADARDRDPGDETDAR